MSKRHTEDNDFGAVQTPAPRTSLKINDVVRFQEGPLSVNALVLGSRAIPDHSGENGEPTLTLVFAAAVEHPITGAPVQLAGTGQQDQLIQVRHDVAHVSHQFSEEQQKKYSKKQYEGGRWRLLSAEEAFEATT